MPFAAVNPISAPSLIPKKSTGKSSVYQSGIDRVAIHTRVTTMPPALPFGGQSLVAQADIIIADEKLLPQAVELYNTVFRPKREVDFFKRRFMGRYNTLTLLARMDDRPVGFWIGFELKPSMFYHWMGGVLPDLRRHGVGRQLQEAQQAWAKDHGYEYVRCECMNHQREFIHFAVALGYDIVGIRWDSTHADNLIVFEKTLVE